MKIYKPHLLSPNSLKTQTERDLVYNGMDCIVTAEVLKVLGPQLDPITNKTYRASLSFQAPVLDMRLRGVKVDARRRAKQVGWIIDELDRLETILESLVCEGIGYTEFNWRSPASLRELFYEYLAIPPILNKAGRITVDRSALERMERYEAARPVVKLIETMRDLGKQLSVLKTEIDTDGRMRTSYNIGGTNTGRLSSSFSEFGTGTNLQNIEEGLRSIFVADPRMKLAYLDAEQGESRVVGAIEWNLFGDGSYLDACESGDLHTTVAKMVWPDLDWLGDAEADRMLAEEKYYRHHDRRSMCKKLGHGTNYGGKPWTLSNQSKIELHLVEDFQRAYLKAFPVHYRWHGHVRERLRAEGKLVSLTGRRRQFWGRLDDDSTLREAIAYDPQGSLADIVNNGMLQVWRKHCCQLLMQVHDAILIQYPEEQEDEIIPQVLAALEYPIDLRGGRRFVVPYGCVTGWNWAKYTEDNPDGLKAYKPNDKRKREPEISIMDRVFHQPLEADRVADSVP